MHQATCTHGGVIRGQICNTRSANVRDYSALEVVAYVVNVAAAASASDHRETRPPRRHTRHSCDLHLSPVARLPTAFASVPLWTPRAVNSNGRPTPSLSSMQHRARPRHRLRRWEVPPCSPADKTGGVAPSVAAGWSPAIFPSSTVAL